MNPIKELLRGFAYPFKAIAVVQRHGLWKILLIPALIQLVLLVVSVWLAIRFGDDVRDLIWAAPGEDMSALLKVLRSALSGLFTFVFISIGLILFLILGPVVAGPFLDIISEKTEGRVRGASASPRGIAGQVKVALFSMGDAVLLLSITLVNNPSREPAHVGIASDTGSGRRSSGNSQLFVHLGNAHVGVHRFFR